MFTLPMTMWSTLVARLLVFVALPLGLTLSGTWTVVMEWASHGTEVVGKPRTLAWAMICTGVWQC